MTNEKTTDSAASALSAGLERIDPDFVRHIEIALYNMTGYARNAHAEREQALEHPRNSVMLKIMATDIVLAEEMQAKISEWFDAL